PARRITRDAAAIHSASDNGEIVYPIQRTLPRQSPYSLLAIWLSFWSRAQRKTKASESWDFGSTAVPGVGRLWFSFLSASPPTGGWMTHIAWIAAGGRLRGDIIDLAAREPDVVQFAVIEIGQAGLQPRALPPGLNGIPKSNEQGERALRPRGLC